MLRRSDAGVNDGKRYAQQVKPFNFGLTCFVRPLGHPPGVDAQRFHLFRSYESDPARWLKADWIDQYSGKPFRITTAGDHGNRRAARVKRYGEMLGECEFHPEAKCADTLRSSVREADDRHTATAPSVHSVGQLHREGIESDRRGGGRTGAFGRERLHDLRGSASRRLERDD